MRIALVLGGAACVEDDVEAALRLGEYQGVVACNDAGISWPGHLDGWTSLHGDKLAKTWLPKRLAAGLGRPGLVAGKAAKEFVPPLDMVIDHFFPGQRHAGSSGLLALKMALVDLGFDRGVCCGVPMDSQGHFFDPEPWRGAIGHKSGWNQAMPFIKDRARSMSGWTADVLGRPTAQWVAGHE